MSERLIFTLAEMQRMNEKGFTQSFFPRNSRILIQWGYKQTFSIAVDVWSKELKSGRSSNGYRQWIDGHNGAVGMRVAKKCELNVKHPFVRRMYYRPFDEVGLSERNYHFVDNDFNK